MDTPEIKDLHNGLYVSILVRIPDGQNGYHGVCRISRWVFMESWNGFHISKTITDGFELQSDYLKVSFYAVDFKRA